MVNYKLCIPIIRKHYAKTNAFKFKGKLFLASNQHGVIYDWRVKFSEIYLDIYTTKSWFTNKGPNFKRRKDLFDLLGIKQMVRPEGKGVKKNNLVKLNGRQIEIVNNYLNNRKKYNSTIKNIISILKGNNPGGEAKKPSSAEMVIDNKGSIKNFVILIDHLMMKAKIDYDAISISATEIVIEDFVKLNSSLESAFKYMQKSKSLSSWATYLKTIKQYYKKYNIDIHAAYSIASKYRNKFSKNIDNSVHDFPFGFSSKDQFQKCHIYEFHDLRDKILESIRNKEDPKKYADMIADPNNFLPLPEEVHRKFDANYFTYNKNGKIFPVQKKHQKYINDFLPSKFKVIPKSFLNNDRKKYLMLRNKNINNFPPQSY